MTKAKKTKKTSYLFYLAVVASISFAGCGDDKDNAKNELKETLTSLIASGNCVDQETTKLSEDNLEYEKDGLAVSLDKTGSMPKSIVFTPSVCKVPQNTITLNGKTFPASHILYLKNVNPSSPGMRLLFSTNSVPGVEKIIRYEADVGALSAGAAEQNDGKGIVLGSAGQISAGNIALFTTSTQLLDEMPKDVSVGELFSFKDALLAKHALEILCTSLLTTITLNMATGAKKDFILPFSINTDPDNICEALKAIETPQSCRDAQKNGKGIKKIMGTLCVNGTTFFMRSFVCKLAESLAEEEVLPLIGMEGCEKGDSAAFCLFYNQSTICRLHLEQKYMHAV